MPFPPLENSSPGPPPLGLAPSERDSPAGRLLEGQNRLLRMVASGVGLEQVLEEIIRFMEAESEKALCSVLLLDEEGKRLHWASAPSLPLEYSRQVDGMAVGPSAGSCGTAVFRKQPVIVQDIARDPLWAQSRALALAHGLYACTSSPILDSRGQVLGTFAFYYRQPRSPSAHDLRLLEVSRDLAGIAIERTRTRAEQHEAIQARDTFLAMASHELKTPVATLGLQVQGLERLCQRCAESAMPVRLLLPRLRRLERQTQRLEGLLDQLLDVSRLMSGRLELEPERLDISELVREVAERHQELAPQQQALLELALEPHVEGRFDRFHLEQVVSNLLSNAVKFGLGKPIRVVLGRRGPLAQLEVSDQGLGIAPEDHARLFQRFERLVSERNYGGFGLGLWISRQLVDAMGGRITVRSQVGTGSTFTVELPIEP